MKGERKIIEEIKARVSGDTSIIKRTLTSVNLHKRILYQVDIEAIGLISAEHDRRFYIDLQQGFVSIHN